MMEVLWRLGLHEEVGEVDVRVPPQYHEELHHNIFLFFLFSTPGL